MKDGSFVQVAEGGSYYKDRVNLVYVVEYRNFNEIIDLSQVEALAFQSGWENDATGKPTIPVYKYIPVYKSYKTGNILLLNEKTRNEHQITVPKNKI